MTQPAPQYLWVPQALPGPLPLSQRHTLLGWGLPNQVRVVPSQTKGASQGEGMRCYRVTPGRSSSVTTAHLRDEAGAGGGAPLTLYVQQKQEATGLTTSGVGVHRADSTHPGSRSGQNQSHMLGPSLHTRGFEGQPWC